jgi:DNA-binding NtrC family response regulator
MRGASIDARFCAVITLLRVASERAHASSMRDVIAQVRCKTRAARNNYDKERRSNAAIESGGSLIESARELLGNSDAIVQLRALTPKIARSDAPTLITGSTGTGKEHLARMLHELGPRARRPFVAINCAAIPDTLFESELFGFERGSFTGANHAQKGKAALADGGILFLDEIGTLPAAGQVKLLRVLESGRFQRLGSNRERQVKVRVISATNADLPALIRNGQFREDLYYRLNAIELQLPPLAERSDDILPLARHFLPVGKQLAADAERALLAHRWPGNVRELRNTIQRASLLAKASTLTAADLGLPAAAATATATTTDEPDRAMIEAAMQRNGGVLAQAANELGLSRQALYRRLERLGIART